VCRGLPIFGAGLSWPEELSLIDGDIRGTRRPLHRRCDKSGALNEPPDDGCHTGVIDWPHNDSTKSQNDEDRTFLPKQ